MKYTFKLKTYEFLLGNASELLLNFVEEINPLSKLL